MPEVSKVIARVIEAEQKARSIIEESRKREAELKNAAEAATREKLKNAREEAQRIVKESMVQTESRADKEYQKAIESIDEENEKILQEQRGKMKEIVERVAEFIFTPEYKKSHSKYKHGRSS